MRHRRPLLVGQIGQQVGGRGHEGLHSRNEGTIPNYTIPFTHRLHYNNCMEPQESSVPVTHDPYEVPEGVRRARAAFIRDFPRLFADRRYREKYVCYHEDTLVGVNKDHLRIIDVINTKNLPDGSYLILCVVEGEDRAQQIIADEGELDSI